MNWHLRELSGRILVRAIVLSIERQIDLDEAKRLAAKQIAAEEKARARSKPAPPPPTYTPTTSHDDASNELVHAKDRFFDKLAEYFRRLDARRDAERRARRAERSAARKAKANAVTATPAASTAVQPAAPSVEQPTPPSNVHTFPLLYVGPATTSGHHVDEREFCPRWRDVVTATWRSSIERNERLQQQREERDRENQQRGRP